MSKIILYPTETTYALGVNPFDLEAWKKLCELKGRSELQPSSWLVRNIKDIEKFAYVNEMSRKIIDEFLPGPLTIILPARETVPSFAKAKDGTVSFRISPDETAQKLISKHIEEAGAPLTCTSANLHGLKTGKNVNEILEQFGDKSNLINEVVDGGERDGVASTIVKITDDGFEILREGPISVDDLKSF